MQPNDAQFREVRRQITRLLRIGSDCGGGLTPKLALEHADSGYFERMSFISFFKDLHWAGFDLIFPVPTPSYRVR